MTCICGRTGGGSAGGEREGWFGREKPASAVGYYHVRVIALFHRPFLLAAAADAHHVSVAARANGLRGRRALARSKEREFDELSKHTSPQHSAALLRS